MRRPVLSAVVALLVGIAHAAVVLGVALEYGYDVGPAAYPVAGVLWRYGGLVALGTFAAWLALDARLVTPVVLVGALAGIALHAELTPPAPVFRDVAELEPSIDEPTGITVVENGLHLVKYLSAWYVWTAGAALVGGWESIVRSRVAWLKAPARAWNPPATTRSALLVAGAAGAVHAAASLGFGFVQGLNASLPLWLWMGVGAVLLLGVPAYLLVRRDLATPTVVAALFFVNSVHSQQYGGPGDPHALYLAAWFVFLGIALLPGGVEYGIRRLRSA
ncbi:hypothetical protein G9C85_09000 [Halorubellus sp. JP-L1]|uniref:hypothetical protein n=1 Tax=Halorubellus sp. JP-L1 TaxID=2715753 RepID=UPI00140AD328|nr:hypothetical protein [Halorubellus sp. JP-L1]NHN41766.1 hypothetical protein [Halorubellus sp. JP-L1]